MGCGTAFHVKPYTVKMGEGLYCSQACKTQHLQRTRTCPGCGEKFTVYRSQTRKFCSAKCHWSVRGQKDNCKCLVCGASFHRKQLTSKKGRPGIGSFCSIKCKAKQMSGSQFTATGKNRMGTKGGKRADLGGRYFRSGWEANWARYLNWLVKHKRLLKWEFEPDTFEFAGIKRGTRFYTPDFKVWPIDGGEPYYQEVKGYLDAKSKTRAKRMKKYHPAVRVDLVDKAVYLPVAKSMRGIIKEWEGKWP